MHELKGKFDIERKKAQMFESTIIHIHIYMCIYMYIYTSGARAQRQVRYREKEGADV